MNHFYFIIQEEYIDSIHTLYDFVINQLHIGRIYGNIRKDNKIFGAYLVYGSFC